MKVQGYLSTSLGVYEVYDYGAIREKYNLLMKTEGTYYLANLIGGGTNFIHEPHIIWVSDSTPAILELVNG